MTGCQLANSDAGEVKTKDQLIGVYITQDYVDLLDMEGYFEDHGDDFINGKDVEISDKYSGKIYATAKVTEEGNFETTEYNFEGIEGIALFTSTIYPTGTTDSYKLLKSDPEVTNRKSTYGSETILEGTLYVDAALDSIIFYINPVYETSDGQVYLMTGNGIASTGGVGGNMSATMTENISETINGVTQNKVFNIIVHIDSRNATEKLIIKQMNDSDEVVEITTLTKGRVPKNITKNPKTTYIILEDYCYNFEGVYETKRKIIEKDEASIECFFMGNKGVAVAEYITLLQP